MKKILTFLVAIGIFNGCILRHPYNRGYHYRSHYYDTTDYRGTNRDYGHIEGSGHHHQNEYRGHELSHNQDNHHSNSTHQTSSHREYQNTHVQGARDSARMEVSRHSHEEKGENSRNHTSEN